MERSKTDPPALETPPVNQSTRLSTAAPPLPKVTRIGPRGPPAGLAVGGGRLSPIYWSDSSARAPLAKAPHYRAEGEHNFTPLE